MLSLAKLASTDQRYYLDQADGRVDHAGSVSSGVEDYYLGGPEAAGRWTGSSARLLGLTGRVGEGPLRAMLSQEDPRSGDKLAGPAARAKVPGYDLMFSVPKSASVLFGIGDERVQRAVLEAQDKAVAAGLEYLERHACRTRMGAGGHEVVVGSGFLAAAFRHRTSRAGDPQVQRMCYTPAPAAASRPPREQAAGRRIGLGYGRGTGVAQVCIEGARFSPPRPSGGRGPAHPPERTPRGCVGAQRIFQAAHIAALPLAHRVRQHVVAKAVYALDVAEGSRPGPYRDDVADRWARRVLQSVCPAGRRRRWGTPVA